jgi:hypothetical protein
MVARSDSPGTTEYSASSSKRIRLLEHEIIVKLIWSFANQRFARSVSTGVVVMIVNLMLPFGYASGATQSSPRETVHSFVTLALRGVSGTFSEEYQVTQGPLSGTVDLAQEAPPGQRSFLASDEWVCARSLGKT